MKRIISALILSLVLASPARAQAQNVGGAQSVYAGTALPSTCSVGNVYFLISGTIGLYGCTATDTWTMLAKTGVDVSTAGQVTATHLASALPTAQGGTGNANGTIATLTTARAINGVNFDGSAPITVTAAGSTLSDTVTVAKGGTGLATLTAHALYVGNGTSAPNALAVCGTGTYVRGATGADPICSTLIVPNAATTGDHLIATSSNTYVSVTPAATISTPSNKTGNGTATFKMNGLACAITPVATGRVMFTITGSIGNGTTADSATWKLAYGTGSAPANADAATGTVVGAIGVFKALTGQLDAPFTSIGLATGLTLNTAVWFDLQIADITGGTASATAVTCTAWEV